MRILNMCLHNTYSNVTDFEWYIEILVHLVRHLPADKPGSFATGSEDIKVSTASRVGG